MVLSPVLWISGRLLVGRDKAKFTDAIWIVVLGTVIAGITEYFFIGWISTIIVLFIWLALVKHFFDCGWLKALAISIIAILIFAAIAILLHNFLRLSRQSIADIILRIHPADSLISGRAFHNMAQAK